MPVGPEPGPGSPVTWSLRKWLYVPRAGASAADVEAWFSGAEAPADAADAPSLAPWREADEPLYIIRDGIVVIPNATVVPDGTVI